ncbi:MAG: hypothetical protein FWB90_06690 [Fibromonadales bacterium]|nr:hypothetical protein [Fibromonadales bacterium]
MDNHTLITPENGLKYFFFENFSDKNQLSEFNCSIEEYNEYLKIDALRSQKDHIAFTLLLREKETDKLIAYMSLIADAIKLSIAEKSLHSLDYPFKTIPAMKVAKLATNNKFREKYKGIGSFMLYSACTMARECNKKYMASRFLTVDADIEHDANILNFYEKNKFFVNEELYTRNRKTVSMRKDIYS